MTVEAEIRRCRPLLGTLVEMRLLGGSERLRHGAADHAFDAVAQVHQLMSFHLPDSDVSRLNAWAHLRPVRVSPWTWTVLREALEISEATDGLFDVTVGDRLVAWGLLPRRSGRGPRLRQRVSWKDIRMLPHSRVRFSRPLAVDLGGIAKGFAVDCAVAALHEAGVEGGVVNAGGDLRAFGEGYHPVRVRDPEAPGMLLNLTSVRDEALATSGSYFSGSMRGTRRLSPLVDPRRRGACVKRWSCSVKARRCLVADALTKVLLILGERAGANPRRLLRVRIHRAGPRARAVVRGALRLSPSRIESGGRGASDACRCGAGHAFVKLESAACLDPPPTPSRSWPSRRPRSPIS